MKRRFQQIASTVAPVLVMLTFFSTIFMAGVTLAHAASGKKGSTEVAKTAVGFTESRIKQLKEALKITDDQEVLWGNVTTVMRENAQAMDVMSKERADNAKTMNAVEQIKFHCRMTEAQLDQQKKFIPPFEALYASLSDSQKTATDNIFRTGKHGKHKIK